MATIALADAAPVINEIHFNPPENPVRQEFVEIYNSGPEAVDLAGWRLSSAVDFVFPDPTPLAAGALLGICFWGGALGGALEVIAEGSSLRFARPGGRKGVGRDRCD